MRLSACSLVIIMNLVLTPGVLGQEPAKPADKAAASPAPPRPNLVPLKLNVVVSKYLNDKKTGSLPYTISLNSDNNIVRLRMGAQVPLTTGGGGPDKRDTQITYRDVGLNIDASAAAVESGLFRLNITVGDSTIASPTQIQGAPSHVGAPVFRNFTISSSVVLKDGQSTQLSTAADPLSGEIMRIDVTLNIAK
jgi:hypothetical protein